MALRTPMPSSAVTIDPQIIAERGLRVLGSKVGSARPQLDIPPLVDLYRLGRLDLDGLVSSRYSLDQINDAVAAVEWGEELKVLIVL